MYHQNNYLFGGKNYLRKAKAWTILILCLAVLLAGCFSSTTRQTAKFHRVGVVYQFPFIVSGDYVDLTIDTTFIVYAGDYMLYELPYQYTREVDNVLMLDTTLYHYFVHKKGAEHGLLLNAFTDSTGKKLPVDSIVEIRVKKHLGIPELFKTADMSKSYTKQNGPKLMQVLAFKNDYFDSGFLYFNKDLLNQPYSLTPPIDSMYQSRLYKADLLMKKNTSKDSAYLNKFRHFKLEFYIVPVTNEAALEHFFDWYKRQEIKLEGIK